MSLHGGLHGKMERWLLLGNLRLNISADIPTECFSSQLGGSKLGTEHCLHLCMQKVSEKPLQDDQRCLCWCTSKMLVHKLLHTHQKCRDEPFSLKTKFSSSFVPVIRAKVSSRVEQENSLLTCLHRRQVRSHFKKIKDTCAYVTYQPGVHSDELFPLHQKYTCTYMVQVHTSKVQCEPFPLKAKFSSCLVSSVFVYIKVHTM